MGNIILDIMVVAVVYLVGYKVGVHHANAKWSELLKYYYEKEKLK